MRAVKSLLAGTLLAYCLLLPMGIFGALFWGLWHQDSPPYPPVDWLQIAGDAFAVTVLIFLHSWRITFPAALLLAYIFFRKYNHACPGPTQPSPSAAD